MEPDLTRTSPCGSAATWRGFLGVRLTVFRLAGAAGFRVLGVVDAITGGGGGGGTETPGASGGGSGAIIGGGGGAIGMGMRAEGTRGDADALGLRGTICFIRGGVRRAVLVTFRGARGLANFFRGAL